MAETEEFYKSLAQHDTSIKVVFSGSSDNSTKAIFEAAEGAGNAAAGNTNLASLSTLSTTQQQLYNDAHVKVLSTKRNSAGEVVADNNSLNDGSIKTDAELAVQKDYNTKATNIMSQPVGEGGSTHQYQILDYTSTGDGVSDNTSISVGMVASTNRDKTSRAVTVFLSKEATQNSCIDRYRSLYMTARKNRTGPNGDAGLSTEERSAWYQKYSGPWVAVFDGPSVGNIPQTYNLVSITNAIPPNSSPLAGGSDYQKLVAEYTSAGSLPDATATLAQKEGEYELSILESYVDLKTQKIYDSNNISVNSYLGQQ